MSRITFSLLVLVLIANSALSKLSEGVFLKNVQLNPVGNDQYVLRVYHTDGSTLVMSVEKPKDEQFVLKGRIYQPPYRPVIRYSRDYARDDIEHSVKYSPATVFSTHNRAPLYAIVADAPADAPKADAPSYDAPKADAPSADAPKADAPSADAPKADAPSADAPKADAPKTY